MLFYFFIFASIGAVLAYLSKEDKIFWITAVLIAVLWSLIHHPIWGAVSFVEMLAGYFIIKHVFKTGNLVENNKTSNEQISSTTLNTETSEQTRHIEAEAKIKTEDEDKVQLEQLIKIFKSELYTLKDYLEVLKDAPPRQLGIRLAFILILKDGLVKNSRDYTSVFEGTEEGVSRKLSLLKHLTIERNKNKHSPTFHNAALFWERMIIAYEIPETYELCKEIWKTLHTHQGQLEQVFNELEEDKEPYINSSVRASTNFIPPRYIN